MAIVYIPKEVILLLSPFSSITSILSSQGARVSVLMVKACFASQRFKCWLSSGDLKQCKQQQQNLASLHSLCSKLKFNQMRMSFYSVLNSHLPNLEKLL